MANILYVALTKVRNAEDTSQNWKLGLLVKLLKKGDCSLCKNWRGIMLLTIAIKVFCSSRSSWRERRMLLTTDAGTSKQDFAKNNSYHDQKVTPRIVVE